jgi:opacity protein-like surface antigen
MLFKKMVLVGALLGSFAAQAEMQNFYFGGQYNKTTLKASGGDASVDFGSLTALAGYSFNDYFAVEARLGTGVKDESDRDGDYSEKFGVDLQTMLLARANYSLSDAFSVFAVAGYSKTDFGYKETSSSYSFSETDTVNGIALGLGAEIKLPNNFAIHLEYLKLPDETLSEGPYSIKVKSDNLSVGLNYYF